MPDTQKIVEVPGVGNVIFPGTMDDASINQAITQHLQGIQNKSNLQRNAAETPFEAKNKAGAVTGPLREAALGAFSGAGIPETHTPIKDFGGNLVQQFQDMAGKRGWEQALRALSSKL